MEEALRALLVPLGRVHWGIAPQGSLRPFIVLTRISGGRRYTMEGHSGSDPVRVQADIYAETYGATKALARRLIAEVSGRRTSEFRAIFVESERDLPAADAEGNGTDYRTSVDLMIHLTE